MIPEKIKNQIQKVENLFDETTPIGRYSENFYKAVEELATSLQGEEFQVEEGENSIEFVRNGKRVFLMDELLNCAYKDISRKKEDGKGFTTLINCIDELNKKGFKSNTDYYLRKLKQSEGRRIKAIDSDSSIPKEILELIYSFANPSVEGIKSNHYRLESVIELAVQSALKKDPLNQIAKGKEDRIIISPGSKMFRFIKDTLVNNGLVVTLKHIPNEIGMASFSYTTVKEEYRDEIVRAISSSIVKYIPEVKKITTLDLRTPGRKFNPHYRFNEKDKLYTFRFREKVRNLPWKKESEAFKRGFEEEIGQIRGQEESKSGRVEEPSKSVSASAAPLQEREDPHGLGGVD